MTRPIEKQLELPEMPPKKQTDPMKAAFELTPFLFAPEVEAIADDLIPQFHSERWRAVPDILYVFSHKAPKARGEDATATCSKVGGRTAWLLRQQYAKLTRRDPDAYNRSAHELKYQADPGFLLPKDKHVVKAVPLFVITWHYTAWLYADDFLRTAVTDHELYHVGVSFADRGTGFNYHIIPHDIEEHDIMAQRYGAYRAALKTFQAALQSGELIRRSELGRSDRSEKGNQP